VCCFPLLCTSGQIRPSQNLKEFPKKPEATPSPSPRPPSPRRLLRVTAGPIRGFGVSGELVERKGPFSQEPQRVNTQAPATHVKTDPLSVSLAERLPCGASLEKRRKAFSVRKAFPAVRGRPSVAWGFRPPSVRSVNLSALEGSQPLGSVYLSKE